HPLLLRHRRTRRDDPLLHSHPSPRLFPLEWVSPFSAGGSSAREAGPAACIADPVRGLGPGRVPLLHPVVHPASTLHRAAVSRRRSAGRRLLGPVSLSAGRTRGRSFILADAGSGVSLRLGLCWIGLGLPALQR